MAQYSLHFSFKTSFSYWINGLFLKEFLKLKIHQRIYYLLKTIEFKLKTLHKILKISLLLKKISIILINKSLCFINLLFIVKTINRWYSIPTIKRKKRINKITPYNKE